MILVRISLAASLLAGTFLARPQELEFEVASVKSARVGEGPPNGWHGGPGSQDPTRLICGQMNPRQLIMTAYGIKSLQVIGPDWLATPRFEIGASVPAGTTKDQLAAMWQKLLSDRFHLAAHHETRETTVFDLVVAKTGPTLTPAGQATPSRPQQPATVVMGRHINFPNATIENFADFLGSQLDHLVRDATGLTGEYAIRLVWTPDSAGAPDPNGAPPLPDALQEQLGLRLEAKKAPVDMLMIDHIDRTPTEN